MKANTNDRPRGDDPLGSGRAKAGLEEDDSVSERGFSMDAKSPEALSLEEARALAAGLREEIRRHDFLYHVEARPAISDARYDELFRRLRALEEAHPELVTADSPTRRVGAEPLDSLPTVEHAAPMLSLDSTQDEDAVRRFDERVRKVLGDDVRYILEPKLDGASLELVYEKGVLSRAVTRGNGIRGEGVRGAGDVRVLAA
ncbi:MAG: DNA ligase LigA-related protein, partial [Longimicrobiales bacterium]